MPNNPVSVALLGPSGIGRIHAREFARAGARIEGVLASSSERSRLAAEELGARLGYSVRAYPDLEAVLESDVLAASICTPPGRHYDQIMALLQAGKFVFAEKPLFWHDGLARADAIAACKTMEVVAAGRLLVNTSNVTFLRAYRAAFPSLPKVERFDFRFVTNGKFEGEQIGIDLLPHALSLLLDLAPAGTVGGLTRTVARDRFSCSFQYAGILVGFDFAEGADQTKELSFAINGRAIRRVQKPLGEGIEVYLQVDGVEGELMKVEDPFAAYIGKFVREVANNGSFYDEMPSIFRNMELMALILDHKASALGTLGGMTLQ